MEKKVLEAGGDAAKVLCQNFQARHIGSGTISDIQQDVQDDAIRKAHAKGSDKVLTRITTCETTPYAYSKDGLAKITVTASGPRTVR